MSKDKIYYIGNSELYKSNLYELSNIEACINYFSDKEWICTDTETEGFFNHSNKIVMLQLSYKDIIFVIDTRVVDILPLKALLESKLVIGQNLKFDYKFLKFHGIILSKIYDTFLAECCITNGLENRELGLAALAKNYCGITLDKSTRNQFTQLNGQPFTEKQIVYGVGDVTCLEEIKAKQELRIKELELSTVVHLENKACLALADIEYNGWYFNKEKWLELAETNKTSILEIEKELDQFVEGDYKLSKFVNKYNQTNLFGFEERKINIKWSSPTQVLKVIKALGIKVNSASEKEIALYQNDHKLIKKYIDYTKERKLVTTYGKSFVKKYVTKDNKIYTSFWQILETHRVSSGSKYDVTPNLQNIPAKNEYLNCFLAGDGYSIIGIDYSGQEARIAAYGSNDPIWVNTFKEGKDLHSEVCKMMFAIEDALVKTKPDFLRGKSYRDVAKTINFGVLFGMSKFKLSKSLQITVDEADTLIKKYFAATKLLKGYLDECAKYGLARGYIRSYKPISCIRWFPQWKEGLTKESDFKLMGEIERASFNTPIQATGALITKLALVKIREDIIKNKRPVTLVHVVHDAVYTRCKTEYAEEYSKIQNQLMVDAWNEVINNFPIKTDITIEPYWSK